MMHAMLRACTSRGTSSGSWRQRRLRIVGVFVSASLVSMSVAPASARADDTGAPSSSEPSQAAQPAQPAQPSQPRMDNRARAQQLFDSALADAEAGNLAAACPKFLASQEADPKTSTLLNLASCYEKNGQTASAWGAFREAEGLARKVSRADWESAARTHAEALEPKLVRLTIDVPAPSRLPGLVIMRDGAMIPAGEWGVAIPVDPGEHVVSATATGHRPWETRTPLRDASGTVAIPVLDPLPPEMMPPPDGAASGASGAETGARPSSWWTPMRTTGVVVAGVGVVGLVTGGVLGLVAKSNFDKAHALCTNGTSGCPASAVSESDSAYGMATGATVVFVIGAAATLGGAALVLFASPPDGSHATGTSTASRPSAALHFGPGAVALDGRW